MVVSPVFASLSIRSILVASGMAVFSFWRPSRGPTSTILTRLSKVRVCWPGASDAVARDRRHRGELLRSTRLVIGLKHFIVERQASTRLAREGCHLGGGRNGRKEGGGEKGRKEGRSGFGPAAAGNHGPSRLFIYLLIVRST